MLKEPFVVILKFKLELFHIFLIFPYLYFRTVKDLWEKNTKVLKLFAQELTSILPILGSLCLSADFNSL